ncbi:hypothetical protein Pla123a_12450 [Posidoniimonas polymericola]|uniref:DUF3891 domain-containing protein n=1 Tax=Posidoniimonas polymericola TaxID=2528002 RepID=A0A5C5YUY1_9BACT|nr:DUF3891 family protein [Posidoniimonas polymericola]TWT78453.1 hypothetical protein Pla123a_12450 [Posidoniimonas polymericola]
MIRRSLPLQAKGSDEQPESWLMISQVEHARISWQLASAWRGLLPGAPQPVRDEVLAAILHHDEGWNQWAPDPHVDPKLGRPYGFTEMPPADAQQIWTHSIDACRSIGPLAGWMVASHFIVLQDKQDHDYSEWAPWLAVQHPRCDAWLAEWLAADRSHTERLANDCLVLLQAFDWLSLWLCCRAPYTDAEPHESLELGRAGGPISPVCFRTDSHRSSADEPRRVVVEPWPFWGETLLLEAATLLAPARKYASYQEVREASRAVPNGWLLCPE